MEDTETAKSMRKEVTELVAKGGFRLTKWTSSRKDVLAEIPENEKRAAGRDSTCIG